MAEMIQLAFFAGLGGGIGMGGALLLAAIIDEWRRGK